MVKALRKQGWTVVLNRAGHWRCTAPNGALYFMGGTPSDHRSLLNARASLRRLGAAL